MGKDPAVLFYTSDFISGTLTMSDEHVGMYIRLLCLQHQKGRLTDKDMNYICKSYVEDVYFKFTKDVDGLYYNIRMEQESLRRQKYSKSRRDNVLHRYNDKKDKSTYVVHMETENENRNEVDIDNRNKAFKPPTLEEVTAYCKERNNKVEPQTFIDHYQANGWIRGKTKIKDWKACVRTWEKSAGFKPKEEVRLNIKPDPKQQEAVAKLIKETVNKLNSV
jgi:hypothetical protein